MAQDIQVGRIAQALAAVLSDTATELPTLNDPSAELLNEIVAEALESPRDKANLAALGVKQLRRYVFIRHRQLLSRASPAYSLRSQLRRHVKSVLENDRPTERSPDPDSLLDSRGRFVVERIREAVAYRIFDDPFRRITAIPVLVARLSEGIWRSYDAQSISDAEIADAALALSSKPAVVVQAKRDGPLLRAALVRYLSEQSLKLLPHFLRCPDADCIRLATGWPDTTLRRRLMTLQKEVRTIKERYELSRGELKAAFAYVTDDGAAADDVAIAEMLGAEVDACVLPEAEGHGIQPLFLPTHDGASDHTLENAVGVMSLFQEEDFEEGTSSPSLDHEPEPFDLLKVRVLDEVHSLFGSK